MVAFSSVSATVSSSREAFKGGIVTHLAKPLAPCERGAAPESHQTHGTKKHKMI